MPRGFPKVIPPLVDFLGRVKPRTVLDIGVGYGTGGVLVRQYADKSEPDGTLGSSIHLVGVEVHEPYRNPMWELYNEVVVGKIESYLELVDKYDLVICNDVFEHLPKPIGFEIAKRCRAGFFGVCQAMNQGAVYGNAHEEHKTVWSVAELRSVCGEAYELSRNYYIVGTKVAR